MLTNEEIQKKHGSKKGGVEEMDCSLNTLFNEARADTLQTAIAHMRVARSGMCLKDRAILLNKINLLEKELKKIEE